MIEIKIQSDPAIIDLIKENFVEDTGYVREVMADEFRDMMTNYPDRILVLVGYDDNKIVGHLVAFMPYNRNYVILDQAFSKTTAEVAKIGFEALKLWAKQLGALEIRMETERNRVEHCALRRYGFKESGVSMRYDLWQ